MRIYSALSDKSMDQILKDYQASSMPRFKEDLIDLLVQEICPISMMVQELNANRQFVVDVLTEGQSRAFDEAEKNLTEIKQSLGMLI